MMGPLVSPRPTSCELMSICSVASTIKPPATSPAFDKIEANNSSFTAAGIKRSLSVLSKSSPFRFTKYYSKSSSTTPSSSSSTSPSSTSHCSNSKSISKAGSRHKQRSLRSSRMSLSLRRRKQASLSTAIAQDPNIAICENEVPKFMNIFDRMDVEMSGCDSVAEQGLHKYTTKQQLTSSALSGYLHPHSHHAHDSVSTASSTNSSPTTTISTVDSATSEERSPSSSPDSPISLIPLTAFNKQSDTPSNLSKPSSSQHSYRSMSPIKKARNTKNLSLNMMNSNRPSTASVISNGGLATAPLNTRAMSAPTSPGFIAPPSMPRRRPSNLSLTIRLPGSLQETSGGKLSASGPGKLRHHVSSPSLFNPPVKTASGRPPRLFSPPATNGPESLGSSVSSSTTFLSSSPQEAPGPIIEMDEEDIAMMANDGEGPKSPSYPEGPVCIYEPNIFLFLEPNADMARNFDVIVNVAREVLNPFDVEERKKQEARAQSISPDFPTTSSFASFTTAFEDQQTTPTVAEFSKRPEYIHMPWDHNTAIVEDLPKLMEVLKARSAENKKVLVHCQCGVSRSASLIIAYGLFMNPRQTVQEAYDFVKARSRWITPNMSLIYQLSDWRAKLSAQSKIQGSWRNKKNGSIRGGRGRIIPGHPTRAQNSSDPSPFNPDDFEEPMTAPLPHLRPSHDAPPPLPKQPSPKMRDIPAPVRTRSNDGSMIMGIEQGPMSAPPGMINIPGTSSVGSHGAGWGAGDAGTGYVPPALPPHAAYPLEQESDVVGDLVGFRARRGSNGEGLPPPTPSFGPKGGLGFGMSSSMSGSMRLNRSKFPTISDVDEPPPTPSFGGPKEFPFPPMNSRKVLGGKPLGPPPPSKKFSTLPFRREPTKIAPPEVKQSRALPDFHRRFPSILQNVEEPPPTPRGLPKSQFFGGTPPVRMPTVSKRNQQEEEPEEPDMFDIGSPMSEDPPRPSLFTDPRSPSTGRPMIPTVRSIFDVI